MTQNLVNFDADANNHYSLALDMGPNNNDEFIRDAPERNKLGHIKVALRIDTVDDGTGSGTLAYTASWEDVANELNAVVYLAVPEMNEAPCWGRCTWVNLIGEAVDPNAADTRVVYDIVINYGFAAGNKNAILSVSLLLSALVAYFM